MIIRTNHKSGFMYTKTWDSIEWVDTPLTTTKLKEIIGDIMPTMVSLANQAVLQLTPAAPVLLPPPPPLVSDQTVPSTTI